jgi:hypothetical protein
MINGLVHDVGVIERVGDSYRLKDRDLHHARAATSQEDS